MGEQINNYEQGYRSALSREEKQQFRQEYCKKSAFLGISLTFANLATIYAAIAVAYLAFVHLGSPIMAALSFDPPPRILPISRTRSVSKIPWEMPNEITPYAHICSWLSAFWADGGRAKPGTGSTVRRRHRVHRCDGV